ncbi:hypothetical protein PsAD2_01055 [Pseudovibrio axinellae]|uniref:Uncharacterized protein n=1 Tax=Pseudovibrio axinellae TaxID=989403 RepID=A0A166AH61_9HYPH|nr:hypothetical protein PsAD2_01055 [Pseudovibrio axinellae]SEP76863.1 hypothetical protein SAMN05421798_101346 [Pseudovibrio axinellae]
MIVSLDPSPLCSFSRASAVLKVCSRPPKQKAAGDDVSSFFVIHALNGYSTETKNLALTISRKIPNVISSFRFGNV